MCVFSQYANKTILLSELKTKISYLLVESKKLQIFKCVFTNAHVEINFEKLMFRPLKVDN